METDNENNAVAEPTAVMPGDRGAIFEGVMTGLEGAELADLITRQVATLDPTGPDIVTLTLECPVLKPWGFLVDGKLIRADVAQARLRVTQRPAQELDEPILKTQGEMILRQAKTIGDQTEMNGVLCETIDRLRDSLDNAAHQNSAQATVIERLEGLVSKAGRSVTEAATLAVSRPLSSDGPHPFLAVPRILDGKPSLPGRCGVRPSHWTMARLQDVIDHRAAGDTGAEQATRLGCTIHAVRTALRQASRRGLKPTPRRQTSAMPDFPPPERDEPVQLMPRAPALGFAQPAPSPEPQQQVEPPQQPVEAPSRPLQAARLSDRCAADAVAIAAAISAGRVKRMPTREQIDEAMRHAPIIKNVDVAIVVAKALGHKIEKVGKQHVKVDGNNPSIHHSSLIAKVRHWQRENYVASIQAVQGAA